MSVHSEMSPFACIVADPPWSFGDALPGASRGAEKNYSCMSVEDIRDIYDSCDGDIEMCDRFFPVANDALLFMWRVSAMVPEAYSVISAWGFTPKSEIVWTKKTKGGKLHFGMGRYVRASHETCIIAARGKAASLILNHSTRSVFEAETGKHSEKPNKFFEIVEALCPGPRLELFARRQREGWTCVGNESG